MNQSSTRDRARRAGSETRTAIQHVALELFTTRGYEATSMREIADQLGIRKASLYYHFSGKEDIVRSLLEQRGDEADELLAWVREQPPTPQLVQAAVLRWVESSSVEKLRGIRFLSANPLLMHTLEAPSDNRIGSTLSTLVDALAELLPERTPTTVLRLRMALLSINAAVDAASHSPFTDEEIITAARAHAAAAVGALLRG